MFRKVKTMNTKTYQPETLDELRNLNIAAAFREQRANDRAATDPMMQVICEAIFFAAEV